MHVLLLLYLEFFKIGLFSVGGGLATIPFLYDLTTKYTWFTSADVADMIAVSESTPGPIGVNMATYAGYNAGAELGAKTYVYHGLHTSLLKPLKWDSQWNYEAISRKSG